LDLLGFFVKPSVEGFAGLGCGGGVDPPWEDLILHCDRLFEPESGAPCAVKVDIVCDPSAAERSRRGDVAFDGRVQSGEQLSELRVCGEPAGVCGVDASE